MTKADKIKICREFMRGKSTKNIWFSTPDGGALYFSPEEVEKALRWGLKHPEELKKGNK